jgi:hypothetical protein
MTSKVIAAAVGLLFFAGCGTAGIKRGHVVMKTSGQKAHVAMATGEVQVGDHVELYHNECKIRGVAGDKGFGSKECKKVSTGHGVVTALFDADYAEVEFPAGVSFSEGDTIEKHSH